MNRFFLCILVVCLFVLWWITFAAHQWTMLVSPATWNFGMRCIYPIDFFVNVDNAEVKAIDMKVIYSGNYFLFTWWTWMLSIGSYIDYYTGLTTKAIDLGWKSYPVGSLYSLFNRYNYSVPLTGVDNHLYYSAYFQTIQNILTWYVDFYFSWGWNGDDSNIQSGVINNFLDILYSVNSWYYLFSARPCIFDVDAPIFTWYASGAVVSYLSWILFTIYDFTGNYSSWYNNTYHYRWNNANMNDYNNYVSVGPDDIDNQYGVNSWTISVSLSGLVFSEGAFTWEWLYTWWSLVYTSFTLSSFNDQNLFWCSPMSTDIDRWYEYTWNRNIRWYDCVLTATWLVSLHAVWLDSNQVIQVVITGADNLGVDKDNVFTWSIIFSLTITGIDNIPPYIYESIYSWTGAYNGYNTYPAWPEFFSSQVADWEYWTRDNVDIFLTENTMAFYTSEQNKKR